MISFIKKIAVVGAAVASVLAVPAVSHIANVAGIDSGAHSVVDAGRRGG